MKKFLASVGHAQLLARNGDVLEHVADVQTLTESSISISTSMEDVRAGEGAKLYGRFSHTSGMTITLTDAMFDLEYIARQVGADTQINAIGLTTETKAVSGGKVTVDYAPQNMGLSCGLQEKIAWVRKVGCSADAAWVPATAIAGKEITLPTEFASESSICVRYFKENAGGNNRTLKIGANFFPAEMILILTTKLFAGDANNVSNGKPVGSITIKIPRFQLDGSFDLSMAMTSAATVSLNGTALTVADGTCDDNGIYAEIVEIIEGGKLTDGLKSIDFDDECLVVGKAPVVYGIYNNDKIAIIDNAELTFTPALNAGKFAQAGSQKAAISGTSFEASATVSAS